MNRNYAYDTGLTITNTGAIAPSGPNYYNYDSVHGGLTGGGKITKITNDGTILGGNGLIGVYLPFNTLNAFSNNGVVNNGIFALGGTLTNTGTITSDDTKGGFGVYLDGVFNNTGLVAETGINPTGGAVAADSGAIIMNSGTFNGGGGKAVDLNLDSKLLVEPGAVFIGDVVANTYGGSTDLLEVEGVSTAALTGIGSAFEGFGTISFATGAAWTIEGDAAGLAAGQTISGLNSSDVIVLNSFAAVSSTYLAGTGLILGNGVQSETLDIVGHFSTSNFTITDVGYTTRITANATPPDDITGTVTIGVTLGSGGYTSPLTITNTGAIIPVAGGTNGVYAAAGTVVNNGTITGSQGTTRAGPPQNGGIGISLGNATLINAGIITGGQGGGSNPGGGTGGAGVDLRGGTLTNSGTITGGTGAIDGGTGGTGGIGLYLESGIASNSGTIIGGAGGAAMYGEAGFPAAAGVMQKSGLLTNTGTIIGGGRDTSILPATYGAGLIISGGRTENQGLIEGAQSDSKYQSGGLGVDIAAGTVTNDGHINGGASAYTGGGAVAVVGGMFTNQVDGAVTGGAGTQGGGGIAITGTGTVENLGFITAGGSASGTGYGALVSSGSLMNAGVITGDLLMLANYGGSGGIVHNAGSVIGEAAVDDGTLTNLAGALIVGPNGLSLQGGEVDNAGKIAADAGGTGAFINGGTLLNSGSIVGGASGGNAVVLSGGDLINNGVITAGASDGGSAPTIPGGVGVSLSYFYTTLANTGTILGGSGGIYNSGGDGISLFEATAFNSGLIEGGFGSTGGTAVYLSTATFTNAGTVEAGQGAITGDAVSFGGRGGTLIVEPGAVFEGAVVATTNFADELELGAGSTAATGTLDMSGSFSGFSTIVFNVDAPWTLAGTAAELATAEKIAGFTSPDTILLEGFTAASDSYVAGSGLELINGATTETLNLIGGFSTSSFLITDTAAGTQIQLCYLRGTNILTPAGEIAIEHLAIGDTVITKFNGYRRIKWIGRQSFNARFIQNNQDQIPVRIRAGALGPNLPKRDLCVSPGHSMLLGDALILASNLVNGVTITQENPPDEIHYHQLEFETHDCILAEGAWSESFCDYADLRNQFHNVAEFHVLYPNHVTPEHHLMCAPRPDHGPALAAALAPVVARATAFTQSGLLQGWVDDVRNGRITGWAQDTANPLLPVRLEILLHNHVLGHVLACDYRPDLAAAGIAQGRCAFTLTPAPKLSRYDLPSLRIRRATDGAALPMGPHCPSAKQRRKAA